MTLTLRDAHGLLAITQRSGRALTVHHEDRDYSVDPGDAEPLETAIRHAFDVLVPRYADTFRSALGDPAIRVVPLGVDRYDVDWHGLHFTAGAAKRGDALDQFIVTAGDTLKLRLDGRSLPDPPSFDATAGLASALQQAIH